MKMETKTNILCYILHVDTGIVTKHVHENHAVQYAYERYLCCGSLVARSMTRTNRDVGKFETLYISMFVSNGFFSESPCDQEIRRKTWMFFASDMQFWVTWVSCVGFMPRARSQQMTDGLCARICRTKT